MTLQTKILRKYHRNHPRYTNCIGDFVEIGLKIQEGDKTRIQRYRGILLAKKGLGPFKTIRIRKVFQRIGIERIFPLNSPQIQFLNCLKTSKVKKAKLYSWRTKTNKEFLRFIN